MNNTKWKKVLIPLVENKAGVKVKLRYHNLNEVGEVVTSYDSTGKESLLKYQLLFSPSPSYYESTSIGPFKPSEIEWLEMNKTAYDELFKNLGIKLMIEDNQVHIKIFGYK